VSGNVLDYKDAETRLADQMLLTNILRAKDGLPIHFSDLVNIHGSVQASAGIQAAVPFGPLLKSTARETVTPQLSFQTAPTFDVNSLDTQIFTTGIMSQLDPKTIKYILDLGLDSRAALLLLFSGIQLPGSSRIIANSPFDRTVFCDVKGESGTTDTVITDEAGRKAYEDKGASCLPAFYRYLKAINEYPNFYVNMYRELRPVGPPFKLNMQASLKDIAGLDPSKYEIRQQAGGTYQLYSISTEPKTALCLGKANHSDQTSSNLGAVAARIQNHAEGVFASSTAPQGLSCTSAEVILPTPNSAEAVKNTNAEQGGVALQVRSVYSVIRYLGDVQRLEDQPDFASRNECITITSSRSRDCSTGNVLFHASQIAVAPLLSVESNGATYSLSDPKDCFDASKNPTDTCDHSLEVLSIVGLLLNLNKSATELHVTPAVQVVP
jgi:hypothetical protein